MLSDEPSIDDIAAAVEWLKFDHGLRDSNRSVPADPEYFSILLSECLASRRTLPITELFRARIMPPDREDDSEPLALAEMGAPPNERASAGRVNPEGIPCFYAALDENTAIAEVRPWNGARLSVAKYITKVPLDILDLTESTGDIDLTKSARFAAHMISRPVHRDDRFGYLGTQYLAESVKAKGVRGILYRSSLRQGGTNAALFTEYGLRPLGVALHAVLSVTYKTSRLGEFDLKAES